MEVIFTLMYIGGGFDEVLSKLQPYEFCSDKVEAITTFMENPNYKSGNGEVWGYNTYNGNKVFATFCETVDRKYWVSYYDPEFEKQKLIDIEQ